MMPRSLIVGSLFSLLLFSGCASQSASPCSPAECSCPAVAQTQVNDKNEENTQTTQEERSTMQDTAVPQTNDIQEVYAFLKAQKTYYIATVDADQPHVRPFGTINLYHGKLYIQTGASKDVAKQMFANAKIELVAYDEQHGIWLRISGSAVHDNDIEAEKDMLASYPELQKMYQPGDGNTAVFYLQNAKAVFYSFSSQPRTIDL